MVWGVVRSLSICVTAIHQCIHILMVVQSSKAKLQHQGDSHLCWWRTYATEDFDDNLPAKRPLNPRLKSPRPRQLRTLIRSTYLSKLKPPGSQ
jgi:hypothetical protein